MANVDVLDLGLGENSGDRRFGRSVIYFFASGHPSIAAITFEHERQRTKAVWEFIFRRVCGALGFVDEDRAWRRIWIESVEWVVGEQDSILFAYVECAHALAAGPGATGDFYVSWMTVLRRFAGAARGG